MVCLSVRHGYGSGLSWWEVSPSGWRCFYSAFGSQGGRERSNRVIWRVAWHDGFGHTFTGETEDIAKFRHKIGPVDWFEVCGAYLVTDQ